MTAVCNRTFDINNKKVDDYKANYSKYLVMREDRREKLIQAKKNQDAEIKQMEDNINKFRASATKASFAQSLIKKLDKIERIEVDNEDVSKFNIRFVQSQVPGKLSSKLKILEKLTAKNRFLMMWISSFSEETELRFLDKTDREKQRWRKFLQETLKITLEHGILDIM